MTHRRDGWALIEVIVTAAIGSVLAGVAITTLAIALRAGDRHRSQWHESQAASQLSTQFRADVHRSTGIDTSTDDRLCTLAHDGVTIVYRLDQDRIKREELHDTELIRRESYAVNCAAHVEASDAAARPRFVRLYLTPATDAQGRSGAELVINARLARDHRFTASSNSSSEESR